MNGVTERNLPASEAGAATSLRDPGYLLNRSRTGGLSSPGFVGNLWSWVGGEVQWQRSGGAGARSGVDEARKNSSSAKLLILK